MTVQENFILFGHFLKDHGAGQRKSADGTDTAKSGDATEGADATDGGKAIDGVDATESAETGDAETTNGAQASQSVDAAVPGRPLNNSEIKFNVDHLY